MAFRFTLFLLLVAGCQSSTVEGLKGRWKGKINCAVEVADVRMGLQVFGESISGSALTRAKELNSDWKVEGFQETLERTTSCRDDSCTTEADCEGRGGSCSERGICVPCTEKEDWLRVTLILKDEDVQSPDPVMLLERFGAERMVGTIETYCRDENLAAPSVELEKEK